MCCGLTASAINQFLTYADSLLLSSHVAVDTESPSLCDQHKNGRGCGHSFGGFRLGCLLLVGVRVMLLHVKSDPSNQKQSKVYDLEGGLHG